MITHSQRHIVTSGKSVRETVRLMWRGTPDDAKSVVAVALGMPLLMLGYLLGWNQPSARISFALAIAILTTAVASLIERKTSHTIPLIFDYLTWSLFAVGFVIVFLTPPLDSIIWRIIVGASQGVMVTAWVTLWQVRKRWLSRTIAKRASLVAGLAFVMYMISNFVLTDPLALSAHWGMDLSKGIVGRTLAPILEMCPVLLLYAAVIPPWVKYLRRHGFV